MTGNDDKLSPEFGGPWTREKLDILESYLDAYTTALKGQPFRLMYVDAFAGTGLIEFPQNDDEDDKRDFISGSAERAIRIADKAFDRLIFVEQDTKRCEELEKLRRAHYDRNIEVKNSEANYFLRNLEEDWRKWRGVLFLDPFATEVEWSTIEKIASFEALDTWILFPVSAIARMLPKSRMPEEVEPKWAARLTRIFGDERWRNLYQENRQRNLFGDPERDPGVERLISIYKENLKNLFRDRLLEESRTFKNSKNSALFEFLFCVGNPRGIKPATRIAKHILERI